MRPILFLIVFFLPGVTPVHADLYKWTDSQGKVHYSDQPPARQEHRRVGPSTNPRLEQEALDARRALADKVSQSERERQAQREAREKQLAEQEQARKKADQCQQARQRLTLLQENNRISRRNDQGQTYILDEAQRQAAIAGAAAQVDDLCK